VKRRRARSRIGRAIRLRLALVLYILRRIGPPLIATIAYIFIAAVLFRWDQRRAGLEPPEFGAALYSIFRQLFFEPTESFPTTMISRAIVLLTPILSVFLLAQGLFKVGSSFLDKAARREVWTQIMSDQMRGHIVVCGLGHVGYRVVEELRMLGEDIIAIEVREHDAFVEQVRAMRIPVYVGDARRDDLLRTVGVERAKAIVCATSDDLANLEIALDAKRVNPEVRVVMRMFDQRLAGKVGGAMELDESFSTSSLAAPLIAIQATQVGVHSAYRLDDTIRVTAEVALDKDAPESTVLEVEERAACRVVNRRRGEGGAFTPVRPHDKVLGGDILIVDTAAVDLPSVRFQLGGGVGAPNRRAKRRA
jgi:Trk K+ transport system NAD-binding subunit